MQLSNTIQFTKKVRQTIYSNILSNEKRKPRIIWTLNSVLRGYSNNSDENLNATFKAMFSDNKIAQNFQLGSDELSYLTNWGVASYFHDKLKKISATRNSFLLVLMKV